jgi:hypothetical protein
VTTTADTAPLAAAPRPRGGIVQSVNDSLVVAKRNLIRMMRIPDPVRPCGSGSVSQCIGSPYVSAGKEQAK